VSDWSAHLQVLTGIIAIVNPIGAIPVFLGLLGESSMTVQRSAARKTAGTVAVGVEFLANGLSALFTRFFCGRPMIGSALRRRSLALAGTRMDRGMIL
jgi:small neutral amino acid transporter SnatA (MarC family)